MAVHHFERYFDERTKRWVLRCYRCGDSMPVREG